ncbi:hypothetical protein [Mycoavidus sp. B2-EB]|uniref:hypothetical protein n=1 Tax=Mycoavidus sp. B2-EB TaxID=2651972 RepID=UPI00162A3A15|nr:hypothetical protein [Mycoavidus sp. B2-EB]
MTHKSVEKRMTNLGPLKRLQLNGPISPQSLSSAETSVASEPSSSLQEIEETHQQRLNAFKQCEEQIKTYLEETYGNPDDLKGIFGEPDQCALDTLHYTSPRGAAEADIKYDAFVQRNIEGWRKLETSLPSRKISFSPTSSNQSSPYLCARSLKSASENETQPDAERQSSPHNSWVSIPDSNSAYFTTSNSMTHLT